VDQAKGDFTSVKLDRVDKTPRKHLDTRSKAKSFRALALKIFLDRVVAVKGASDPQY